MISGSMKDRGWPKVVATFASHRQNIRASLIYRRLVLKGLEDKTFSGASIASPSAPWGGGPNANEPRVRISRCVGLAISITSQLHSTRWGDRIIRALVCLLLLEFSKKPDGSFPHNSWVDGPPDRWRSTDDQSFYSRACLSA